MENPKVYHEIVPRNEDRIREALELLVKHAGFEEYEENVIKRLREFALDRISLMCRQFAIAEQRKLDNLRLPYSSPLIWTLTLNDLSDVTKLKSWYDTTYTQRFTVAKLKWNELKSNI
ncbi:unnamed protein product [Caenorhabditis bovis]|uniref:Uncharacterized protein n=1 Tax=Caenorhabditis bovis TaxID=2654633 RepID=A0A8S1E0F1_9PELO|nr:unnamed protein product [Caenorhabditis bovis]